MAESSAFTYPYNNSTSTNLANALNFDLNRAIQSSMPKVNVRSMTNIPGSTTYNQNPVGNANTAFQMPQMTPQQQAELFDRKMSNLGTQDEYIKGLIDKQNAFDWAGTANVGISAFDTWNQWDSGQKNLKLAQADAAARDAETARRNATRDRWSTAFQNA